MTEIKFKAKVTRTGKSSKAIIIPYLEAKALKFGDTVDVTIQDGKSKPS